MRRDTSSLRKKKPVDWTDLYEAYRGKWVALKKDRKTVIVSGAKLVTVVLRAKEEGYENPITTYVPRHDLPITGVTK